MIRRPMMYITSLFAAAVTASHYFSTAAALFPVIAYVIAIIVLKSKAKSISVLLVISYLAGIFTYAQHESRENPLEQCYNEQTTMICRAAQVEEGTVKGIGGNDARCIRIKAYIRTVNETPFDGREKILIKYYPDDNEMKDSMTAGFYPKPGSCFEIKGEPALPDERKNPGCFDYALYLNSVGIRSVVTADEIKPCTDFELNRIESFASSAQEKIYNARESFLQNIKACSGAKTAGLMRAVMFGEKTELDEDTLEDFRKNGTAHVLAVSGLHIGIVYGFLSKLWAWKRGDIFFALIVIFFLIYMVMAAFSPSVVRAVFMIWLHVFANITNRRYDMPSAAFFTGLVMLIDNPMHIFNAGFQMSFLAVLTLSLMIPLIKRLYSGIFAASIAIQAGLFPYIVYTFNYISLAAVFVNVPIIFLTGIIVPIGMCSAAMMYIHGSAFELAASALGGLCEIMTALNDMTGVEGLTVFDAKSPPLWLISLYYLSLMCFVSEEGRLFFMRRKVKKILIIAALVLSVSLIFGSAAGNNFKKSDVVFVDVGQGDCIHFRTEKNGNYMVDGGGSLSYEIGEKTLKPYLLKNGASHLDGAFVTHLHTDHYRGIAELCREGMVRRLYVYEGYQAVEEEILEDTGMKRSDITYLYAGQRVVLDENVFVEVLWPEQKSMKEYEALTENEEEENSLSLIMKINVKGRSVLVTGDVDTECLDKLAEEYMEKLDTDILKAAHHGSKYSSSEALIKAAKPEFAVFQVGKNNFGHPDKGVVENFRQNGIIVYRNDTDGAIAFEFTRDDYVRARTVKGE